jgi:hypothetical protein
MSSASYERAQEIARTFDVKREHRFAQIERRFDFEDDPDPVTIKATDPATGAVLAHFHMDEQREVTNLAQHPLTQHLLGTPTEPDETPGVVVVDFPNHRAGPGLLEPEPEAAPIAVPDGKDFPDGMTVEQLDGLCQDWFLADVPASARVHAWTRDNGTIYRIAAVPQ